MPSRLLPILCLPFLALAAPAQRIVLPQATGTLQADATWTTLRAKDIEQENRPDDPPRDPARRILLTLLAQLRQHGSPAEHVVLHRPGSLPDSLVAIHCYSQATPAKVADLLSERAIAQLRGNFESTQGTGTEVSFVGHETADVFPIGSLLLHFEVSAPMRHELDLYVVPAGEHLQYFEVVYPLGDPDARQHAEAVLRTFDGAKEGSTLHGMFVGGALGAVTGILAAMLLRSMRKRRAAAAGTDAGAS